MPRCGKGSIAGRKSLFSVKKNEAGGSNDVGAPENRIEF
jgi:hypothetical protein